MIRWIDQTVDAQEFNLRLLWHLRTACPICATHWEEAMRTRFPEGDLLTEVQSRGHARGLSAHDAVDRVIRAVCVHKGEFLGGNEDSEREHAEAAAVLKNLRKLTPNKQSVLVEGLPPNALTLRLATLLVEAAREVMTADPGQARHSARLAGLATKKQYAERLPALIAMDMQALGAALEGNAFRLQQDYPVAFACFCEALRLLPDGTGDPIVFADVLSYRASYFRDQWMLDEARREVRHALKLYKLLGEKQKEGRARLQLSAVEFDLGESEQAAATVRAALPLLKAPELRQLAHENLALYLGAAGGAKEAWEILRAHPSPAERPERYLWQRRWKEGLVLRKLGKYEEARNLLESVREAFLVARDVPNAAVASIDLALLAAEQGQPKEVIRVTGEILPALLPFDLPDQILALCILLQEAVDAQAVTVELLRTVQRKLRVPALWPRIDP